MHGIAAHSCSHLLYNPLLFLCSMTNHALIFGVFSWCHCRCSCFPSLQTCFCFPRSAEEDFKDAQDAVAHTAKAWNDLLSSVAAHPDTAAELRRSTGQKMKQLEEELRVMTDALIHDD